MNKKAILVRAQEMLEAEIKDIEQHIQNFNDTAKNAPSPMESWSDSTRRERQNMALAMEQTEAEAQKALAFLKDIDPKRKFATVQPGALVRTEENGKAQWYFIAPKGGGHLIQTDDGQCTAISPDSKIGARPARQTQKRNRNRRTPGRSQETNHN